MNLKQYFEDKPYPGRVILIGKNPEGSNVLLYAITGRSPSSQARKLVVNEKTGEILVSPTNEMILNTGNPDLLIYPAIYFKNKLIIGNGVQTKDINTVYSADKESVSVLIDGQLNWTYEPDAPNYTPRISGCTTSKNTALSILKHGDNDSNVKNIFQVLMVEGKAHLISTYTGVNENPLPSFTGEPVEIDISNSSADELAQELYDALEPAHNEPDFRVVAAAVVQDEAENTTFKVINRHELD